MCGVMLGETPVVDVDGRLHGCAVFADSYQTIPSAFVRTRLEEMVIGRPGDPDFRHRYAQLPAAVRRAEIFHHRERKRSSYEACADCRYLADCSICPVAIGWLPGNEDPHRIPDYCCAFNRVALKYRERFPALWEADDAPLAPRHVREERRRWAALVGTRASFRTDEERRTG
jgi:hypothetical protein